MSPTNAHPSVQSAAYGACIYADYNNVTKDICAKEFLRLKECYLVRNFLVRIFC